MRVSKAAVCDTFINVTDKDDRWTPANSITEQGFVSRAWLGRERTLLRELRMESEKNSQFSTLHSPLISYLCRRNSKT